MESTEVPTESYEELKKHCDALAKENDDLRLSFEEKRNKFKEVYQTKEKTVTEQSLEIDALRTKLSQKNKVISDLNVEIEDIKMIASVSENTKQEAVERLNKRHQEETESLRRAMEDSNEESQHEMVRHFERERRQWGNKLSALKSEKDNMEAELEDCKKRIRNRKLSEEEELEASMQKAHAEAEKLKSVVLPLEKEISKLKNELEETKANLTESQKLADELAAKAQKETDILLIECKDTMDESNKQESMVELDHSLKSEKTSRTDLECHIEVLRQQNKAIEDDKAALDEKMQAVLKQFELEKAEHAVLKQTWLAANDQFLESQRLLMRDNNIIEGVLSEDQRRQVKMLKLKAQASEARDVPAKSPMSSLALLKKKTDKFKEAVADSLSQKSDTESDTQSFGSFQDCQEAVENEQEKVSIKLTLPESKVEMLASEADRYETVVSAPGQRIIDESQWNEMVREIQMLRSKLANGTFSETPEKKHADLFEDDAKMVAEVESLKLRIKHFQHEKEKASQKTNSLEESIRYSAEDAQKQILELANKLTDFERLVGNLKEKQIKVKAEDINNLVHLRTEKDKYRDEVILTRKERDKLLKLQEKHQNKLLKEALPKTTEGLSEAVAQYRSALSSSRAEKDVSETKLRNEIAFLQERLKAEQSTKEQLESSLASELHDARGEIISLQSLKTVKKEISIVEEEKTKLHAALEKSKTSFEALQTKSNEIIKGLREKHLAEIKAKEDVETSLLEAKNRLRSLQSALETSEHVQRDFVRLSQSLQVQLEQVREEREKEKSDAESVHSLDMAMTASSPSEQDRQSPMTSPKAVQKTKAQKSKSMT